MPVKFNSAIRRLGARLECGVVRAFLRARPPGYSNKGWGDWP